MGAIVKGVTILGIDAIEVGIEAEVQTSLRRFSIVGLPDGIVKEAKDRVKCAIENSGFTFPSGEVIVSLSPASLPKVGSGFDLAIALSIIAAEGLIPKSLLQDNLFIGELTLDGSIKAVGSEIAALRLLGEDRKLFCSTEAKKQLSFFSTNNVVCVESLGELISIVRSNLLPTPLEEGHLDLGLSFKSNPFGDVIGQAQAKRALTVCAAGGHNVLMIGPPGSGKTMLAERLSLLMPSLSRDELMEVNQIYGVLRHSGMDINSDEIMFKRPFRSPHHSTSVAGLIGGGTSPNPGEVTLAHRGVLFIDEFPELRRDALECLREPLENRSITITRAKFRVRYPSDFILVAAMNPCPCGKRGSKAEGESKAKYGHKCECTANMIKRYVKKISAPILDRIDVQLWIPVIPASSIHEERVSDKDVNENEVCHRSLVEKVRQIQEERYKSGRVLNSSLKSSEIKKYCKLEKDAKQLLDFTAEKYELSTRAYMRILKLGRTIADLDESTQICAKHIGEAIGYRVNVLNHV